MMSLPVLVPCSIQGVPISGPMFLPWRSLSRGSHDVTSCLAAWSHAPSVGVSVSGPMFLLGRSLSGGGLYPWGSLSGRTPPRTAVKSGRYASYWNAFLYFSLVSDEQNKGDKIPQKIFKCPHISM